MALSADMTRLVDEMREAYDSRVAAVEMLHTETVKRLDELQVAQREMATQQRQQLDTFAKSLHQQVTDQLQHLQGERAAMSAAQQRDLDAYAETLRRETQQRLAAYAAERQAMTKSQAESLASYKQTLKAQTSALLSEASTARAAIHADHAAAQTTWRQFCSDMDQRRAGHSAKVTAKAAAPTPDAEKPRNPAMRKQRAPTLDKPLDGNGSTGTRSEQL